MRSSHPIRMFIVRAHLIFSLLGSTLLLCISASSGYADSVGVDANGRRHTWPAGAPKNTTWVVDIIKMVPPEYPNEARRAQQEGSGRFRLQLDLGTGKVTKATVLKSTGVVMLDNKALWALRRWQFKPGRWRELEVPITFSMSLPRPLSAPKTSR
jgi:TonB family protein